MTMPSLQRVLEAGRLAWRAVIGSESQKIESSLRLAKFAQAAPSPQNAVDIFRGRWASSLSGVIPGVTAGPTDFFIGDPRPKFLLANFASPGGNLSGQRILELGPLECAHTYQLEKLGADEIVAVEANTEAYLKCLVVKELTGLKRSSILYGDFVSFLREDPTRYDVIFCSGVLYHMEDPLELVELIAKHTDRIFVWTHYWDPNTRAAGAPERDPVTIDRWGEKFVYFRLPYENRDGGRFWGGNKDHASWLSRDDIMRAFRAVGFGRHEVHEDQPDHPNGPCLTMSAWR